MSATVYEAYNVLSQADWTHFINYNNYQISVQLLYTE